MNNLDLIASAAIRNDFGMLSLDFQPIHDGVEAVIYYPCQVKRKTGYAFTLICHGRVMQHVDGLSMDQAFDQLCDAVRLVAKTRAAWQTTLDRHARA